MLNDYLNYIQETIYNKEVHKISVSIPIELHFDPTVIKKWSERRSVTLDLSYERFKQYRSYFKDIDKYLIALDKVTRMRISNIIKRITIFVIADKRKHNYSGVGKNTTRSPNKSHTYVALGIESKPHVLVYFCHELGHSFIFRNNNWNKKQFELCHMMIEYFTDWRIWNMFNRSKNVFVTRGYRREAFNRLIDDEYGGSGLDANKFTTNIVLRYNDYIKVRSRK